MAMSRMRLAVAGAMVSGAIVAVSAQQQPADLLAAARQALGGDAALNSITTLTISATSTLIVADHQSDEQIEIYIELPDKYVRHQRQHIVMGPIGSGDILNIRGFNGDAPIIDTDVSGNVPPMPPTPTTLTAATFKRAFVKLTLPLFAASFAGAPVTFSPGGDNTLTVTGPAAPSLRMWFDDTTHLPSRLTWMDKPIVSFTTSRMVAVGPRGQVSSSPPPVFPDNPTANMADVPWEAVAGNYTLENGVNWPRTITTSYDGHKHEVFRISKIRINPKIDAKIFTPINR